MDINRDLFLVLFHLQGLEQPLLLINNNNNDLPLLALLLRMDLLTQLSSSHNNDLDLGETTVIVPTLPGGLTQAPRETMGERSWTLLNPRRKVGVLLNSVLLERRLQHNKKQQLQQQYYHQI
jgi:hypothetical protein